ncbi:hypothetical protein FHG89_03545 [Micromonospora orduensis]|uniref:Uncharacterized protein n=1 Tax=Micromonospora orduensis TaxID=1420891 RepID=A0A5C4QYY0_9ACTN|nr:hypothetical protein [Micromonospora orduensis]TNH31184.1 hypothetical protein FHG89_03545 [Micromonospora orduensis]
MSLIGIGVAAIGAGVAILTDGAILLGVAMIGAGLAAIGGGVAVLTVVGGLSERWRVWWIRATTADGKDPAGAASVRSGRDDSGRASPPQ